MNFKAGEHIMNIIVKVKHFKKYSDNNISR